jgi:subtilisin family serine protease
VFRHAGHVAGIAAAPDNGIGTIGVAPEATIIGVKVLHGGGGNFSWIIQGIEYASRSFAKGGAGADIINMSLRGIICKNGGTGPLVAALNKTITTATRRGVLVISAAGHDGINFDHSWDCMVTPAESGNGIAISATGPVGWALGNTNFRRSAHYTNYGNSLVHVAAPGGDWVFDMVFSVYGDIAYYGWAAGTSMATPVVAGVAALIKQRFPDISVGQWKNMLANTADDEGKKGHDSFFLWTRLCQCTPCCPRVKKARQIV